MSKLLVGMISVIVLIAFVSAAIYTEPWNQNQRGGGHNLTDMGWISAYTLNGTNIIGTFTGSAEGDMNWTFLKNYPVACPGSSAVTAINDSVTCSDLWLNIAGDEIMTGNITFTNAGILNLSFIESLDWSNVNISESQIYDLQTYLINNSDGWTLNFTKIFSDDWTNITITESQISDLQNYIVNATNLTIADKITFRLGEIIDNIVNGWITITGGLNVTESITATGNITGENIHLLAYISTHTNVSITAVEGVWLNVTFGTHADSENARINHTYNDATNYTFTIVDTGIYQLNYGISYLDSESSPDNIVGIRITKNDEEIHGSVFEKDTTKQNALGTIFRGTMASLTAGDDIILQFISNSTSVSLQTAGTYGDHPTSAQVDINRI